MANFFSLGSGNGVGGDQTPHQQQSQPNNNNPNNWAATSSSHPGLVVYRNEEIYQKGFEIWQQYVQVHHHHTHPFLPAGLYVGDQMPNAATGPSNAATGPRSTSSGSRVMIRGSGLGSGSGAINCQDCGNQAKKDCSHMRCRTCCKSRGFHCSTHVKSTWVPAAKRRERQQQHQHQQPPSLSTEIGMIREKRPREGLGNDHTNSSRMGASTSGNLGLEMGQHFPAEISSAAVFRCVRVQSVENAEEQLAYQTAVNIGGHMFKGLLYDQGPDAHYPPGPGGDQNLLNSNSNPNSGANNASSSGAAVDPNGVYPPPMNAFLAGTQFFPPPRS